MMERNVKTQIFSGAEVMIASGKLEEHQESITLENSDAHFHTADVKKMQEQNTTPSKDGDLLALGICDTNKKADTSKSSCVENELHMPEPSEKASRSSETKPLETIGNEDDHPNEKQNLLLNLCQSQKCTCASIENLLTSGVDINYTDEKGYNALFHLLANAANDDDMLASKAWMLIEKGIDLGNLDNLGWNVICFFREYKHTALENLIIPLLKDRGVDGFCVLDDHSHAPDQETWYHKDCSACSTILTISREDRIKYQHYSICDDLYGTFFRLMEALKAKQEGGEFRSVHEISWEKLIENIRPQSNEEHIQHLKKLSNLGDFNCNNYETDLKCLRKLAELIPSEELKGEVDYLFRPFMERKEGDIFSDEVIQWDKTRYELLHDKNDEQFAINFKNDVKAFSSIKVDSYTTEDRSKCRQCPVQENISISHPSAPET